MEAAPRDVQLSVEPLIPPDLAMSPGWRWLWDRLFRPVSEEEHEGQEAENRVGAANTHAVCRRKES